MKVKLKDSVDVNLCPIVECLDENFNEYLRPNVLYEIVQINIKDMRNECNCTYMIISNDNKYGAYFSADLFEIVDDKIDNDWTIRHNNNEIIMAPSVINYQDFWNNYVDGCLKEEKIYCERFGHIVQNQFSKKWFRKIFNDYQDPSMKATGVDTQADGYVVCPHCYNAEQVSAELGVIKCEKCKQEYNNPLAKICPSGIEVVDE